MERNPTAPLSQKNNPLKFKISGIKGYTVKKFNIKNLLPLGGKVGIYVLYEGEEVVYVGQSKNLRVRILEHCFENTKDFDSFKAVNLESRLVAEILEMSLINTLNPKYNVLKFDFFSWYRSLPETCRNEFLYSNYSSLESNNFIKAYSLILSVINDTEMNKMYNFSEIACIQSKIKEILQ